MEGQTRVFNIRADTLFFREAAFFLQAGGLLSQDIAFLIQKDGLFFWADKLFLREVVFLIRVDGLFFGIVG